MPGKMSKAKTPEALIEEQPPKLRAVMKHLGSFVRSARPSSRKE